MAHILCTPLQRQAHMRAERTANDHEHRHSGIVLHTPASVHFGTAGQVRQQRQATLHAAFDAHPERFRHRRPEPPKLPSAAWVNQPSREALIQGD